MTASEDSTSPKTDHTSTYERVSLSKIEHIKSLSSEELTAWVKRELNFWREISTSLEQQNSHTHSVKVHSSTLDPIQKTLKILEQQSLSKLFKSKNFDVTPPRPSTQFLNELFSLNLPQHDDPLATDFKNACHVGGATAALYAYRMTTCNPEKHYMRGYEEGVSENLKNICDGVDVKTAQTLRDLGTKETDLHDCVKDAEQKITKIVAAATSAIALSEPVKFWDDRKVIHNTNAQKYGKYATWSAIIFAITLFLIVIYEYMSGTSHSVFGYDFTLPKSLSGIAIILLISTAGIWSTRIFVKLMMANLTLETESIERATMIKTFVAMKAAEASIAQEAELLFYTTLFRPSNNVISEESTAPEFGKILDAILKVKPDKPGSAG